MNGVVIRALGNKGFGFIQGDDGQQYFFHQSALNGFFSDLVIDVDQGKRVKVQFEPTPSPKGPRAEEVVRLDGGIIATN